MQAQTGSSSWKDRWEHVRQLGAGGQGFASLVRLETDHNQLGVVKTLRKEKRNSKQDRGRMAREVASLKSVRDAGGYVPAVIEHNTSAYEQAELELYFVMEFVDGHTLAEYVKEKGPLSVDESLQIVNDICHTLSVGHRENVLHRDLKPENIVLSKDAGRAIIVDYGLSFNEDDSELTETDEAFRNRFLNLPETQALGGNRRDLRSDITAVCAVLYFCLTGHAPGQLRDEHGRPPHRRPDYLLPPSLSGDLRTTQIDSIFSVGFTPEIEYRFQSIQELVSRLKSLEATAQEDTDDEPGEVALRLQKLIIQMDRGAQLAQMRPTAANVLKEVKAIVKKSSQQLTYFSPSLNEGGLDQRPPNVEPVSSVVVLHLKAAGIVSRVKYFVAAKGMQYGILRAFEESSKNAKGKRETRQIEPWEAILWTDGSIDAGMRQLLERDVKRSLNKAMHSIVNELQRDKEAVPAGTA
jgi:serine/threonine protein kinase